MARTNYSWIRQASRFKRLDVGDVGHNTLLCWQLVGTMSNCPIA